MARNLFFLLIILFVSSCELLDGNTTDDKIALARVDNNYLYIEDIIFPSLQNDSSLIIETQTNQWIRNQLLLKLAYENVINVNNVENQVLQYKNNLILFEYEKITYQNNIDFLVSDEELNTYYENNIKDFVLPFDLVKALYAKIPVDAPDIGSFRKIIKEYPDSDINEIRSYCFRFAEKSFLEDTIWVKLDEIILNNPLLLINDKSQFLKRNTYVENVDKNHYFFLKILDKRLIGETSPLSFESNVINAIILNKRKQKLFDKLRDSIFVNSKKGIDYEIF
ncbi:uncharacterized protein METZ01_LOCUS13796 [marine metagenome]|jgi:hypothetical protein|uniref:PpiC domain-containing protein n=1 Tax=marine metagenome TaxID=408172 RepID=A0A381P217_9ZZZZ